MTRWLVIVLPIAVAVAGVAMLISIEALIGGLPACAVIGLVLSFVSAPLASWRLHLFAVSAPLMAAACAIIISSWRLSPGNAYAPINCTWWVYAIFLIAFSRRPILDVWRRAHPAHYAPANWQFSIRFMLLLTAVLSACLATTKWIIAGVESDSGSGYTARGEMMGFALAASAVVFVIGLATARFLAYRAQPAVDATRDHGAGRGESRTAYSAVVETASLSSLIPDRDYSGGESDATLSGPPGLHP